MCWAGSLQWAQGQNTVRHLEAQWKAEPQKQAFLKNVKSGTVKGFSLFPKMGSEWDVGKADRVEIPDPACSLR